MSGASHGRQVRANQQGDPPHTSALRPVWHTDLAPLVCPGPCSVPPDRWSQVHSEVVTTDVPALVQQHDGPAQMGQGLHGAESFSTTETAAELVQGRPEAETPKSRAGRPTVACWVSIFMISGIPGNPRCCHGRDAEGPDSPARHSSIRAAAISRHADRARSGHAHGSGGRGCERPTSSRSAGRMSWPGRGSRATPFRACSVHGTAGDHQLGQVCLRRLREQGVG